MPVSDPWAMQIFSQPIFVSGIQCKKHQIPCIYSFMTTENDDSQINDNIHQ